MQGDNDDNNRTQPIGFACPMGLIAKLKASALKEGISTSEWLRRAVEAYLRSGHGVEERVTPDPKIWW